MYFPDIKALLCSLVLLIDSNHAFMVAAPTSFNKKTTSVPHSSLNVALVPPVDLSTVESGEEFDKVVQKTYGRYPLTIKYGKGCKLYDIEDKEYLDFVSGIATCALGHANEELSEAISNQMKTLHHVSNLYYIPEQAALAKWLCDNSVADKAFFCNSGAEANEGAIKLARKHASNRGITDPIIITAVNSFHGRTLAAISATGQPKYHKGFSYGGDMVQGFEYIPYNDIDALKKKVEEINTNPPELEEAGRKRGVAAIMLESLQGEGGIVPGDKEFFAEARSLCDSSGALLMLDEVQAGMGRTGKLWGYENLDIVPDVFTSAKALGGGVPIGAMLAKGEAASVFGPGDHASTYGGNPLACASALTVAKYMVDNDILTNVNERGAQLKDGLESLAEKYPSILGEVRGWGLLRGVVVHADAGCTAGELVGDAMKEGLLLVPAGTSVVRFVPPLIVTEEEITKALELFELGVKKRLG
eukprot:CAMPEP_0178960608 /NCGR_PEP_ID=MMETSP0789-20121207/13069_1 /TAXON_ID=3005 /ORGANISM="Rhizosolenia setigera, Strain CCMP 1694" /LENGTH=472 /DNA_ID=CAMNT_0020643997 /DNA_START=103 /DNA_END=1521 /DNA_ORIENTATION=-